jgi:uncharacterized membrane protein
VSLIIVRFDKRRPKAMPLFSIEHEMGWNAIAVMVTGVCRLLCQKKAHKKTFSK